MIITVSGVIYLNRNNHLVVSQSS